MCRGYILQSNLDNFQHPYGAGWSKSFSSLKCTDIVRKKGDFKLHSSLQNPCIVSSWERKKGGG
jgi:hypothetical protein